MNKSMCVDVRKGLFSKAFIALAADAVAETVFTKGVNRIVVSGTSGIIFAWTAGEQATAADPATTAALSGGTTQLGTGIRMCTMPAVIELAAPIVSFKIRNIDLAAQSFVVEGHVVGSDT